MPRPPRKPRFWPSRTTRRLPASRQHHRSSRFRPVSPVRRNLRSHVQTSAPVLLPVGVLLPASVLDMILAWNGTGLSRVLFESKKPVQSSNLFPSSRRSISLNPSFLLTHASCSQREGAHLARLRRTWSAHAAPEEGACCMMVPFHVPSQRLPIKRPSSGWWCLRARR